MKLYGIEFRNKIQRQKNKPDGKLFLVNRHFLCPGALPMLDTIRSQRVLTPPGHPFFRPLLTSGLYRANKSRLIRFSAIFCPCFFRNKRTNGIPTSRRKIRIPGCINHPLTRTLNGLSASLIPWRRKLPAEYYVVSQR